jgi:cytosine/adenosine deaminase-related metal-dependent hydrolase
VLQARRTVQLVADAGSQPSDLLAQRLTAAPALASGKQVPTVDLHQRDMLRMATIDAARVWHLEDEIGTLTPHLRA